MYRISVALFAVGLAGPALAINTNVFKEAPVSRLSSDEVNRFKGFVIQTLDNGNDGITVEWKAAKTHFISRVTPLKSFEDGKQKCREATIDSNSQHLHMKGTYTFCKTGKGEWQFKIPDSKGKERAK